MTADRKHIHNTNPLVFFFVLLQNFVLMNGGWNLHPVICQKRDDSVKGQIKDLLCREICQTPRGRTTTRKLERCDSFFLSSPHLRTSRIRRCPRLQRLCSFKSQSCNELITHSLKMSWAQATSIVFPSRIACGLRPFAIVHVRRNAIVRTTNCVLTQNFKSVSNVTFYITVRSVKSNLVPGLENEKKKNLFTPSRIDILTFLFLRSSCIIIIPKPVNNVIFVFIFCL